MTYIIEKITTVDGVIKRERVGREGVISFLELGKPMLFAYTDLSGVLRTSPVEAYSPPEPIGKKSITVQTRNSVYTITKTKEGALI